MFTYELVEQAKNFINGEIGIEQLEDWLTPRLEDFLEDTESLDCGIAAAIEDYLALYSDEAINLYEFRLQLAEYLEHASDNFNVPIGIAFINKITTGVSTPDVYTFFIQEEQEISGPSVISLQISYVDT
jgi:hypothetical protein